MSVFKGMFEGECAYRRKCIKGHVFQGEGFLCENVLRRKCFKANVFDKREVC